MTQSMTLRPAFAVVATLSAFLSVGTFFPVLVVTVRTLRTIGLFRSPYSPFPVPFPSQEASC